MKYRQWIIVAGVGVASCLEVGCQTTSPASQPTVIELTFPAHPSSTAQIVSNSPLQSLSDHFHTLDQTVFTAPDTFTQWLNTLLSTCQYPGGKMAFDILAYTQRLTQLIPWALWCHRVEAPWASQALLYTQWVSPEILRADQEQGTFVPLTFWLQERLKSPLPPQALDYSRMLKQLSCATHTSAQALSTLFEEWVALPPPETPSPEILKEYVLFLEQENIIPAIHPWRYYEILATP